MFFPASNSEKTLFILIDLNPYFCTFFSYLWNTFGIGRVEPSWMTKCIQQSDTNALIINTRQGLYAAAVTWPRDRVDSAPAMTGK